MLYTDPEGREFQAVQFSNDESIPALTELVSDLVTVHPTELSGLLIITIGAVQHSLEAGNYLVRKTVPMVRDDEGAVIAEEHEVVEIVKWQEFVGVSDEEIILDGPVGEDEPHFINDEDEEEVTPEVADTPKEGAE